VTSEQVAAEPVAEPSGATPPPESPARRGTGSRWLALIGAVILLDVVAFVLFPPFPKGGAPGDACGFPACFIESSLEFPAPHIVLDFAPGSAPAATDLVTFHPSISSTILTMWIVMALVIAGAILMTRGGTLVPRRAGDSGGGVAPEGSATGSVATCSLVTLAPHTGARHDAALGVLHRPVPGGAIRWSRETC
jgi:hypothetical protein